MGRHTISKKRYLELGQVFHWAVREHYQLMFTGNVERHSRTEKVLPRLVEEKKLVAIPWGQRLIYSVPRRTRGRGSVSRYKIEHGLSCTSCLVRTWLSRQDGVIISEKKFIRFRSVADWGIAYPNGSLLIFEFASYDNFNRVKLVRDKIAGYVASLDAMLTTFACKRGIVLYVADTGRGKVKSFVQENDVPAEFYFTDYETFKSVPFKEQLSADIYIWQDGRSYPLTNHD